MIKKKYPKIISGILSIYSGANNTIFTLSDKTGNVIYACSPGSCGFKGAKKSTPVANQAAFNKMKDFVAQIGVKELHLRFRGYGMGGSEIMMQVNTMKGVDILSMESLTNLPHNGTPEKNERRV